MFPLLNLPMMAHREVFKAMGHKELMLATFLSTRTKLAIKASFPKNLWKIAINVFDTLEVAFTSFGVCTQRNSVENNQGALFKLQNESFRLFLNTRNMDYCIEPLNGITDHFKLWMIDHFVEAFNNPVVSLTFGDGVSDQFVYNSMRYFKDRKLKINRLTIRTIQLSAQTYTEVLNSCTDINEFMIGSNPPPNFQYVASKPFTAKSVCLRDSCSWINLEDFTECEAITLINSEGVLARIDSGPLISVVKKVMAGESKIGALYVPINIRDSFPSVVEAVTGRPFQGQTFVEVQSSNGYRYLIRADNDVLVLRQLGRV